MFPPNFFIRTVQSRESLVKDKRRMFSMHEKDNQKTMFQIPDYLSDHCGTTIDIYSEEQIRIKTVRYGSYNNSMSCSVIILSGVTDRMMIYFKGTVV